VKNKTKSQPEKQTDSVIKETLRESEEKYRLIFDYSPMGLLSFDEKGVIIACNDNFVRIIGSSREKLVGLNMLNLPDKKIVSAVQKALNGGHGLYEGVYSSVTAKKSTPVRCLFAPMNVGGGDIPGGVGIIEDITERKQAEEAVKVNHDTETHEILYINRASYLTWGDIKNRKCHEYLQHRDTPCPFCTNSKILGEYSSRSYVWEFQNEVNQRWY
jgi:PAS domain S-box-containing protein